MHVLKGALERPFGAICDLCGGGSKKIEIGGETGDDLVVQTRNRRIVRFERTIADLHDRILGLVEGKLLDRPFGALDVFIHQQVQQIIYFLVIIEFQLDCLGSRRDTLLCVEFTICFVQIVFEVGRRLHRVGGGSPGAQLSQTLFVLFRI